MVVGDAGRQEGVDRVAVTSRTAAAGDAVVVLTTDGAYLDQARQVLAALHCHGGWKGDYLLLYDDVDQAEMAWFERRGVEVLHAKAMFADHYQHLPPVTFSRYEIFRTEIRRWRFVIFLDLDMIVRSSISRLLDLPRLGAVPGSSPTIRSNFVLARDPRLGDRLEREFDLDQPAFNAGMMAFPTDIVETTTFERLCELTRRYLSLSRWANQGLLNLLFIDAWTPVPPLYNAYAPTYLKFDGTLLLPHARIIHFNGRTMKPWQTESPSHEPFMAEWSANLDAAHRIPWFPAASRQTRAAVAGIDSSVER